MTWPDGEPWWVWVAAPAGRRLTGKRRYDVVGHRRALSALWRRSIGLWGGVVAPELVLELLGLEADDSRLVEFRKSWKVRAGLDRKLWPDVRGLLPRYQLAERSWDLLQALPARGGDALRAVGRTLHVLPVEVAVMQQEMVSVLADAGLTYHEYREHYPDGIRQEIWDDSPIEPGILEYWNRL